MTRKSRLFRRWEKAQQERQLGVRKSRKWRAPHWSRRAFLGGAGAVLTLPFLESLAPKVAFAQEGAVPTRLLFYYIPNGIHMNGWTPSGTGTNWDLTPILSPLVDFKNDLTVISGLANAAADVPVAGDHARGTGSFLTCMTVKKTEGDDIENGVSVDQVAANHLSGETRFDSMQLGINGGAPVGGCDSGYSCAYARNISWAGPSTPLVKQTNPQLVFDRLFEGFDPQESASEREKRKRYRKSVLDYSLDEANSLKNKLGSRDQQKLDEYMTGIRDLETRIDGMNDGPTCDMPGRPDGGYSGDVNAHIRVMTDLMALAFECDQTRVLSFMQANAGSNRRFDGFLSHNGSPLSGQHHELSHHQGNTENHEKLQIINTWEIQQFTYLLEKLSSVSTPDDQSLLDHTLVFFSSEIEDGNSHRHSNLPVLLAGGGGGAVFPGRHIVYDGEPIANLFVSMMQAVGVPDSSFGMDGSGPLAELSG